jgi:RNA polymerase sigma-70 factor (ECF subfamily)
MVQETFMRGYRAIGTITDPGKVGSWLYGIAVRTCLDWLKAKERSQISFDSLAPDGEPADLSDGQPPATDKNDRHDHLLNEIQRLPEIYRETLALFYFQKQSYQEMSATLGISPAAINARLTKARAMLRARLTGALQP